MTSNWRSTTSRPPGTWPSCVATWDSTLPEPAARLATLRTAALERIAAAQAELADVLDSASSTTGDDEHDPEGATIGFERAQSAGSLRAAEASLAEIDAALARMDAGTYGGCVRCGRPIGDARLEARPATAYCIDHA